MYFGTLFFNACVFGYSALFLIIGGLMFRENVRIGGPKAWAMYILFGWIGGLVPMPFFSALNIYGYTYFAAPMGAIAFFASIPWINWGIPAIAGDFNIRGIGAALTLAFLVGLGVVAAGYTTGDIKFLIPIESLDWRMPEIEP